MATSKSRVGALRHSLLDPEQVDEAMEIVALTPDVTPEMLDRLRGEYRARCERICAAMDDLVFEGDESEAEKHIPLTWLATRYEWSRCNDRMQYQTITRGQADTMTMAEGSMLSKIAEKLEAQQTRQELFWTFKLAADPFGTVARIPELARRLMRITASAGSAANEVLQEFHSVREALANQVEDRDLLDTIDDAIARSIECVDASVGIELNDLNAALEAELVECLGTSGVTALLEMRNRDGTQLIPPDVCDLFLALASKWLGHLFAERIESSPDEREANGKSAHVTLSWRLERNERKLTFTMSDDGKGTEGFAVDSCDLAPGLTVRQRHEEGKGSELTIESNFMLNANAEYLSFSVSNGQGSSTLAIPAQFVSFIELVDKARIGCAAKVLFARGGEHYPLLDTARAVFGAATDYERDLVVFADLGEAGRLALRADAIHGIARGRVKPLPFGAGGDRVAGVLNNGGELTMVLDIEEILKS